MATVVMDQAALILMNAQMVQITVVICPPVLTMMVVTLVNVILDMKVMD
jgi:hypothetical protein